jgi:hypothetical protein
MTMSYIIELIEIRFFPIVVIMCVHHPCIIEMLSLIVLIIAASVDQLIVGQWDKNHSLDMIPVLNMGFKIIYYYHH